MKYFVISTLLFGLTLSSYRLNSFTNSTEKIEKQFKFIPSGKVLVNNDTISVNSFSMLDHEVTNGEYRAFTQDLEKSNPELYEKVKVNDSGWQKRFPNGFLSPMDDLYFNNEAYDDYPVVNISQLAAREYCKWLTKKINLHRKEGEKIILRLPKRAEFIRAGAGDVLGRPYAWGDQYMRNAEGRLLCNFTRVPQTRLSRNGKEVKLQDVNQEFKLSKDEAMLTAKTKSYYPSIFEIYDLNGNVAEWIDKNDTAVGGSWYDFGYDVRLQSAEKIKGSSPKVGFRPVFTTVQ